MPNLTTAAREWRRIAARGLMLGALMTCTAGLAGQSPLVRLPGHVSTLARSEYDLGEADASLSMSGLQLVLARTPTQDEALKKLIADQQNPRSPQYHRWLTPAEFGARFGASRATITALSSWLESQGLKVGTLPAGRDYLPFTGTKEQVEAALHIEIHAFNIKGARHYSNVTDPSIPANFKGVIAAIGGLNDFHPTRGVRTQTISPPTSSAVAPLPEIYQGSIGAYGYPIPGFVGPGDAANIYDLAPLYAKGIDGKGVTVAIVAESDISAAQLSAYWTAFGMNQGQSFKSIPVPPADGGHDPGQTSDGNEDEAYLDTEIIGGLAPGASLLLVRDKNAGTAAQYIIDQDSPGGAAAGVGIINFSFGGCEASEGAGNTSINNMFQKAATEGITITAAAGDTGADQTAPSSSNAGCMSSSDQGVQGDVTSKGLAVSAFASTPYVLAVGGTDFDPNLEGTAGGVHWSRSNTPPTLFSAAAHVPEMAWNTSCGNAEWSHYFAVASTLAFCNQANLSAPGFGTIANPYIEVLGGGGGISSCTSLNGSACAGGYAQPAWQQGVEGITSFGGRAVPDVSAIATRWVICSYSDNPCMVDPLPGSRSFFGTSAATPVVAAIIALVDQSQQPGSVYADGRQGLINPLLYQLAAAEYGSAANLAARNASQGAISNSVCVFYDITLGSNAEPCPVASFSDTGSAPASMCDNGGNAAFTTGLMTASSATGPGSYPAERGYDLATGLGSIDAANLVAAMSALAAPGGLTASAGSSGITLQWSADPSATTFNVYQGTASGHEAASPVQTGITTDSTVIAQSTLTPGQTYFFEIAAVTAFVTSPNSAEASAMAVPAVPSGLSASASNGTVMLSWSAATAATTYNVYQGTSAGGEGASPVTSVNGTTATISGLTNGTIYYFKVAGVDAGGVSAPSSEVNASPFAPTGGAPGGGGGGGGGSLDWLTLVGLGIGTLTRGRRPASDLRHRPAHDL